MLPAQGRAMNRSSQQCIVFLPVLVFDFWFVQNPWFPVQTQGLGKGWHAICIAGEKSRALLCVTPLTDRYHYTHRTLS